MELFPCRSCAGFEMSVPADLTGSAPVRCACCGATLGSWDEFRRFCADVVSRDARVRGERPVSGDPIRVLSDPILSERGPHRSAQEASRMPTCT